MKIPDAPPKIDDIFQELKKQPRERLTAILGQRGVITGSGKYLHWDKLQHLTPPAPLTVREWWLLLKGERQREYAAVPLHDKKGAHFQYNLMRPTPERLHKIDLGAGGIIQMPDQITNPQTRDQYCVNSLIEEAITSSQLEGAATTRPIAKEMIRTGREPRDISERMILNNFKAMQRIQKVKHQPLSRELVFEIHRIVTEGTLDDPSAAGRFRRAEEHRVVGDEYGQVFHDPPDAHELEDRMAEMCRFANQDQPFIHPVVRSIILHFWLAYDHPFVDGNGRTARALFYWSMLRRGYWLFEYVSISQIIHKAPVKYGRAFLYTETDDNDLSYFIRYHLEVIDRAISELHDYLRRRTHELERAEHQLRGIRLLNHRQRELVGHAMRHPQNEYTIEGHRLSHNVVYQTARTDLLDLEGRGLFSSTKRGRTFYFRPAADIEDRLSQLS